MNGDVEVEASRPRPLSSGLWTIFSWLRRSERSSSSESISSVGSDRTAASFDFLSPIYYPNSQPQLILPPNSPTDSYKKRVYERNLRRQRETGVTLHRKYGLWREDVSGYEGFSLPPVHKSTSQSGIKNKDRSRRAASECLQRRAAHVPGKRRAPLPPTFSTTSLPRNYKRKRPAPKPPLRTITENKENIEINQYINKSSPTGDRSSLKTLTSSLSKTTNSQENSRKETKFRSEKSFLKQIFENKKRHSAIDISHVKLLPNISELDKQAAEIIETNKVLRHYNSKIGFENNKSVKTQNPGTMWMCTKCFRKYNMTIKACVYCVHKNNELSNILNAASSMSTQTELKETQEEIEEKKKLKEMLKEMKHSLPKKSDQYGIKSRNTVDNEKKSNATEAPTLRIGSTVNKNYGKSVGIGVNKNYNCEYKEHLDSQPSSSRDKKTSVNLQIEAKSSNETSESIIRAIITSSNLKTQRMGCGYVEKNSSTPSHIDGVTDNFSSKTANSLFLGDTKNKTCKERPINNNYRENETVLSKPAQVKVHQQLLKENVTTESVKLENTCATNKVNEKFNVSQLSTKNIALNSTKTTNNITIHTPLKISSLLNPIYQLKEPIDDLKSSQVLPYLKSVENNILPTKTIMPANLKSHTSSISSTDKDNQPNKSMSPNILSDKVMLDPKTVSQIIKRSMEEKEKKTLKNELTPGTPVDDINNDHTKRRHLIHQLELAIAKGDEKVAAEAATKLAKLRLSCSVLSFSSQIIGGPSSSRGVLANLEEKKYTTEDDKHEGGENNDDEINFIENVNDTDVLITGDIKQIHTQKNLEQPEKLDDIISIDVWIEDKVAARGPVRLNILRRSTIADLKKAASTFLGLEVHLQRWIVGKTLCNDDSVPIISIAGPLFNAPFYLCLVESEDKIIDKEVSKENISGDFYSELIKLEQQALIANTENFECGVCIEDCVTGNGAVLRECLHSFCRECLNDVVRHCEEPVVSCPAIGCPGVLQDREIRALLSKEDYEKWLARGLAAAENGIRNTFHCRTADCTGWAFCEAGVRIFPCPVCKMKNCIPCQSIHEGVPCEQYQRKLRETVTAAEASNADEGTQALLNSLISRGEALECPECCAIITKKWGCDWVKCSACKTEICWVTKGRRWGPGGRGDTSGGCRCGIDGKRCHPTCGYCH